MGYYTDFEGQFEIIPPLDTDEVSAWCEMDLTCVKLQIDVVNDVIEQNGRVYRSEIMSSRRLVPAYDNMKAYEIIEEVRATVLKFSNHEFRGHFYCQGENSGDIWRLVNSHGIVGKIRPTVTWDETNSNIELD